LFIQRPLNVVEFLGANDRNNQFHAHLGGWEVCEGWETLLAQSQEGMVGLGGHDLDRPSW
jgi:hypothetical protein